MPKILILHGMNPHNMGDTAIVKATIARLQEIIPNAEITLVSNAQTVTKQKITGVKILKNIIVTGRIESKNEYFIFRWIAHMLDNLLLPLSMFGYFFWALVYRIFKMDVSFFINEEKRRTLKEYLEADVVISRGGGFLNDVDISLIGNRFIINAFIERTFLFHLYSIFFAVLLKKKTVIYGQSIGPFKNKLNAYLTKLVLNKVDLITVRDRTSKKWLKKIGVNAPKVYVTADEAFLFQPASGERVDEILSNEGIKRDPSPLIGVNVRKWFSLDSNNPAGEYKRYVKAMAECINYLIEKLNATVIFIPQSPGEADTGAEKDISQMIGKQEKLKIINSYPPEEMKGIIGKMDLFIGTHMHSSIFSLSMNVPSIIIAYSHLHKTEDIIKMVGMEKWMLSIKGLESVNLISKINEAFATKNELQKELASNLKNIQKRSMLNAELNKSMII